MAIGQAVPMVDWWSRVTGEVAYALNLKLPGMLHARVLHSPHAHARLVRVDTSRAERLPGVAAAISRNDLLGQDQFSPYYGPVIRDQTPLALDRVRYVGEPVAAVAAVDEDTAAEALDLIEVEYEELPAVFDPEAALAPGAPLLHEGPRRVIPARLEVRARSKEGTNIIHLFTQRKGDVEQGFREADLIIENVYTSPPVAHVPMEPHNAIAQVRDGRITIWTSNQSPHLVQMQIADIFRLPTADVRVIVSTLGGGYGGKINARIEPMAALLAWKARRPVRLALRRNEEFLVYTQHAVKVRLKTGVKRDGTLVAHEATCYYNGGPFADSSPNLIQRAYASTGPYRVPNLKTDSYGVYTNALPAGAFRGYGITQVAWAHELQMDLIADQLGIDPLELRRKNVLHEGEPFTTGEPFPECHYPELLEEAARRIGWGEGPLVVREGTRIRAKGLSCIVKGAATVPSSAIVKLNGDGSLNVLVSSVEMGQGAQTVLGQIAADEAGLPFERVRVSEPDTAVTPFDHMTAASRTTFTMGTAVRYAVQDVKRQLLELGADLLEVSRDDVVLEDGRVKVRGAPDRSLGYGDVVRRALRGNLLGHGYFGPTTHLDLETGQGKGSAQWHPAVVTCEVEVDTETGKVEVTRLHACLYVGRAINPRFCELQVEGSALFGLGQALFEEVVLDTDGRIANPNLSDYMIPSFEDVPHELTTYVLESAHTKEVHGIGETAVPPIRPAIGNAVNRALGTRIFDLPLTPERVLRALQEQRG
ncbi:MAG: xanthine dehydrogenase family protein [Chloroflexi bacterium]|nr:xanthine dehydrogenase family protein [Chloroflexota bacterium]